MGRATKAEIGYHVQGKPKATVPSTAVLEEVLAQGRKHLAKVMELLRALPADADLLDREGKLSRLVQQVARQIAVRKGAK